MSFEPIAKRRSYTEHSLTGFTIVVPAKKQWFTILFLLAWLGGWAVGEVSALRQILAPGEASGATAFLIFWLCGWTLGGLWAAFNVLWMLAGSERITVTTGALIIRKQVFGVGREKAFDLSEISGLRVHRDDSQSLKRTGGLSSPGIGGTGTIAFDYGARTVRFATGIDEAEATMIVGELSSRYSFGNE